LFAFALPLLCALLVFVPPARASEARGARDHSLFRRPERYELFASSTADRAVVWPLADGTVSLTGRLTERSYRAKGRPLSASALGYRFAEALRTAGGQLVFQENLALGGRRSVGRLSRPGYDVWAAQEVLSLREYRLSVLRVPKRETPAGRGEQPVLSPERARRYEEEAQALELLYAVERAGKLEFPAAFDAGGSVLQKGRHETGFRKFALMMEKDPSLYFRVETYTDSDRKPAEQRALLRGRAAAVIDALTALGADGTRLTAETGDDAPLPVPRGLVRLTLLGGEPSAAGREPASGAR
jgi:outer membrane protein OmpA-like peptidoglycan-associated protein